jgi:glycosyltransferase involved in cell wall biosynthesis
MKISIITATYNSGATVRDTLESIKDQAYPDIEHIIVDGKSKDNTLDIVHEFPHVAKVVSEKDGGIYDAMNKGVSLASGNIIGILNSDDIYAGNDVLTSVVNAFADDTVDAVYGDLQYVKQNDLTKITRHWKAGNYSRGKFYLGWMPPHPSFFVRSEVYEQIGKFNLSLRSSADYELMLRALFVHRLKPAYLPKVLVKMRTGGMSNASLQHRFRANREDLEAWELNGLKPYFFTIPFKPLRKIFQFIQRQ